MKTGFIRIEENENGDLQVNVDFQNGNIWMTIHQIADLFEVYVSSVSAKLKMLCRNGLLDENEVKRNCKVVRKKPILMENGKTYVDLYNIEAILMLSFHLSGRKAKIFREWTQTRLNENKKDKEIPLICASMVLCKQKESN